MTASAQDVVEAVFTRLTADNTFNTSMGGSASIKGRIYHQIALQNDALPLCVFDVVDVRVRRAFVAAGTKIIYEFDLHFDIFVSRASGTAAAGGAGVLEEELFARIDSHALDMSANDLDRGVVLFTRRGVRTIEEDVIRISSDARVHGAT